MREDEDKETRVDFRELLKTFRKHLGLIITCGVIMTVFGSVYTFFIASRVYTASTQLVTKLPDSDLSTAFAAQVTGNIQIINTINQVIVSPVILNQVQKNLSLNESIVGKVTATSTTNSQVITVTVQDSNPYTAQKIANETATVFSKDAKNILNVTNVSVLSNAELNTTPVSPKPKLYIPISLAIGLIVGLGISLILETFNNKITSEQELEAIGFTALGSTQYVNLEEFLSGISNDSKRNYPQEDSSEKARYQH